MTLVRCFQVLLKNIYISVEILCNLSAEMTKTATRDRCVLELRTFLYAVNPGELYPNLWTALDIAFTSPLNAGLG